MHLQTLNTNLCFPPHELVNEKIKVRRIFYFTFSKHGQFIIVAHELIRPALFHELENLPYKCKHEAVWYPANLQFRNHKSSYPRRIISGRQQYELHHLYLLRAHLATLWAPRPQRCGIPNTMGRGPIPKKAELMHVWIETKRCKVISLP